MKRKFAYPSIRYAYLIACSLISSADRSAKCGASCPNHDFRLQLPLLPPKSAAPCCGSISRIPSPEERQRLDKLTNEDHADMMVQLGIKALRPGHNGSTAPGTPNQANYDQAKANPFPDYPCKLTLKMRKSHHAGNVVAATPTGNRRGF